MAPHRSIVGVMRYSSPLAAIAAALVLAAPAQADSISYLKDGNVWLSTTDGARQFQVTFDGGYTYASQAENGVIVATKGRALYRLARTGEVINEIHTALGPGYFGPYEASVSPDGRRVAYEMWDYNGYKATTYADTDNAGTSYPLHTGWGWPAWIDNETLLHSEKPNVLSKDLIVRGATQPNNQGTPWYKLDARSPLLDVDIKGHAFAGVAGEDGQLMTVFRFTGAPGTGTVEPCYEYSQPVVKIESPSFSPDGTRLAWNEGDGVWISAVPDMSAGCAPTAPNGALTIPGGRYPDWSAADVPGPRQPPTPQPPGGGGQPPAGGGGQPPATTTVKLTPAKTSLATALKKGLTVKIANATAPVKVTAAYKNKTVASGKGTKTVRLKFTKKAAKMFKAKRSVKLTLKAPGVSTSVTLKR